MKYVSFLVGLQLVFAVSANAEIKGCYERKYDAGVLQRHPKQSVTYITLRYGVPPNDQEGFVDDLSFKTSGSKTIKSSDYKCSGSKIKLICKLEDFEDAGTAHHSGSFVMTETKDGVVVSPMTDLVVTDLDASKLYKLVVNNNTDNKTFTLRKINIDLESCGVR